MIIADQKYKFSGDPVIEKKYQTINFYSFTTNTNFSFLAFLTSFQDNFKSNWTTQEIYGRMDPIAIFKNTTRSISFGFDIPSYNLLEGLMNSATVDLLIQGLYPTYKGDSQAGTAILNSPPLYRVFLPSLIEDGFGKGLLGYFDGFSFKPKIDQGFYSTTLENIYQNVRIRDVSGTVAAQAKIQHFLREKSKVVGVKENPNTRKFIIPKLITADINFNVIHDLPLGRNESFKERRQRVYDVVNGRVDQSDTYNFPHSYYELFSEEPGTGQDMFSLKEITKPEAYKPTSPTPPPQDPPVAR